MNATVIHPTLRMFAPASVLHTMIVLDVAVLRTIVVMVVDSFMTEMNVLVACEFKEINGFDGYRVTSDGRVQSKWRRGTKVWSQDWVDLRPSIDKKGYLGLTNV